VEKKNGVVKEAIVLQWGCGELFPRNTNVMDIWFHEDEP